MKGVQRTGAPWRDLPERFGSRQSVHDRFNRWRRDGTLDRTATALRTRLDRQGKIDWDLWCIDDMSVRAARSAADASKGSARTSRKTTRWGACAADGDRSCAWSLTAQEFPLPPASPQARHTSRRSSSA